MTSFVYLPTAAGQPFYNEPTGPHHLHLPGQMPMSVPITAAAVQAAAAAQAAATIAHLNGAPVSVTGAHGFPHALSPGLPTLASHQLQALQAVHSTLPMMARDIPTAGMKRASDDMLSQSMLGGHMGAPMGGPMGGMGTNGSGAYVGVPGEEMLAENSDAKKAKMNPQDPSRVVHIRGMPSDTQEAEIVQMGMPFGKVTNVMLMRKKNQAFLEMEEVSNATTLVNYHMQVPAQLRGKPVYIQYSTHKTLNTDQNPAATAAIQAASAIHGSTMDGGAAAAGMGLDGGRIVLRAIVDNLAHPVTIDVFKQIFSRFGQVLKIVTFTKNNQFQSLIQYADPVSAQTARVNLDGQNIFPGCCTLRIDFSKLTSLNIKYNNDKSRDFTNPSLPTGDGMGPGGMGGMGAGMGGQGGGMDQSLMPLTMPGLNFGMGGMGPRGGTMGAPNLAAMGMGLGMATGSSVVLASNLDEEKATPDSLFTLFGVYGDVCRVKILYNKKDNALIQYSDPAQAQIAVSNLDKVAIWGRPIRVTISKHMAVQMPTDQQADGARLTKDFTNSSLHRYKKKGSKNYSNIYPPSATLHLSNIPPDVEGDFLQEQFSSHGAVVAFKFFEKDHKMALIQMSAVEEAVESLMALHNSKVGGDGASLLKVSFSKSTI